MTTARRNLGAWLTVAGFLSAPLAACLVPEPYAIDREMVVVPFGVLLGTAGLAYLRGAGAPRLRQLAAVLMILVPVHFVFFLWVYFGEYRARAAFWFEGNHQDATRQMLAAHAERPAPEFYLNVARIPVAEGYWRLALVQHEQQELLSRTRYFHPDTLDLREVPAGSLLLMTSDDTSLHAAIAAGALEKFAEIPEISGPPFYVIARRK
jgi:hypothetical protein